MPVLARTETPARITQLINKPLTTPKHKPNNLFKPLNVLLEAVAESNNFEINQTVNLKRINTKTAQAATVKNADNFSRVRETPKIVLTSLPL